jgi:hypothetical protein
MKPEQFIREYGVEKAREVVEGAPKGATHYDIPFEVYLRSTEFWNGSEWKAVDNLTIQNLELPPFVDFPDLKRLVESLDLFKELKTKKNANREFMKACMRGQTERANQIKRAIEAQDAVFGKKVVSVHESIYGGGENA